MQSLLRVLARSEIIEYDQMLFTDGRELELDVTDAAILAGDGCLHRLDLGFVSDGIFGSRCPLRPHFLAIFFVRIGKGPPVGDIGHVLDRITKQLDEFFIDENNLFINSG